MPRSCFKIQIEEGSSIRSDLRSVPLVSRARLEFRINYGLGFGDFRYIWACVVGLDLS